MNEPQYCVKVNLKNECQKKILLKWTTNRDENGISDFDKTGAHEKQRLSGALERGKLLERN